MAHFAVVYTYADAEKQAQHRPAHREYLSELLNEGKLVASGPFVGGDEPGALLIFTGETAAEIEGLINNDPMNVGGAVLSFEIHEWNPVLGGL
ncbi:YciI family protein [Rothia sp. LK2588]|uniref:YciI family protein n=1 Tax=Rothia sp. LK2588 TaxID=3114369 RepID=UPI0034CF06B7